MNERIGQEVWNILYRTVYQPSSPPSGLSLVVRVKEEATTSPAHQPSFPIHLPLLGIVAVPFLRYVWSNLDG